MRNLVNVKKQSVVVLYLIFALPLLIAALAQFGIIDLSGYVINTLTLLGGMFVLFEVGGINILRRKNFFSDPFRAFGGIVAIVAILGATLSFFNISFGFLNSVQGTLNLLVVLYVVIEGFRK